jgi:hypothetical protein
MFSLKSVGTDFLILGCHYRALYISLYDPKLQPLVGPPILRLNYVETVHAFSFLPISCVHIPNNCLYLHVLLWKDFLKLFAIWNCAQSVLCEFSLSILLDLFASYTFHHFRNFYYVGSSYLHKAPSSHFHGNLQKINIYSRMMLSVNG